MQLDYHIVDVFTSEPFEGNALAVVIDGSQLDTPMMQRIAREFNLSETTFIVPGASTRRGTRVRIFTPGSEMEFAGHPTIGTAYMLRRLGIVAPDAMRFTLEENVGPVSVRVGDGEDPLLWLTTPPIRTLLAAAREDCAAAVSLELSDLLADAPCQLLTAGNPTLFIPVKDASAVDRAAVDSAPFNALVRASGVPALVFVFAPIAQGAYSRMFAPHLGVAEDPATGSATGPLAAFMMQHGLVSGDDGTTFISEQGTKMGRRSLLHVRISGKNGSTAIEVGGNARHIAAGRIDVTLRT
ncbi:MAG TPA: PhzF family phenazine biosynthesis protein [Candidatus Aquilonibacter sp.]